jgi:hypothetical protein
MPKHLEELLVVQLPDGGDLEFEQGVLSRVHVDGVDVPDSTEEVIEGIAPRGRDDEEPILRGQLQGDAVEPGIFPAGVVDEVVTVDEAENSTADPFTDCHGAAARL